MFRYYGFKKLILGVLLAFLLIFGFSANSYSGGPAPTCGTSYEYVGKALKTQLTLQKTEVFGKQIVLATISYGDRKGSFILGPSAGWVEPDDLYPEWLPTQLINPSTLEYLPLVLEGMRPDGFFDDTLGDDIAIMEFDNIVVLEDINGATYAITADAYIKQADCQ